jgi:hypothetical protein
MAILDKSRLKIDYFWFKINHPINCLIAPN